MSMDEDVDLIVDLRNPHGVRLSGATGRLYRMGEDDVIVGHLEDWPVFPDLLIDEATDECIDLAFSINERRINVVQSVIRGWSQKRYETTDVGDAAYEPMFRHLGVSAPYLSIRFDEPREAVAQIAQLGPEAFAWLIDMKSHHPIGCVVYDFLDVLQDHGATMVVARKHLAEP